MLNKNDPLIGVVQEVMKKNQAERDTTKLVNEYFGITDRKALPHELQGEWNAAYQTVLTEGVESLDEANFPGAPSVKMPRSMAGDKHTKMYGDLHSKLKSLADSGKINTPEGRKEASGHIDAIQNLVDKHLPGNPVPSKKTWLSEDQLEEASLAGLAPPLKKTTRKDVLVGRGVLKKHPTQPGKHVLAKEGSDVTSPSGMGITKPDYATGTPAYAKSKEQTVNRTDKTSLPPGTVAKNIKEEAVSKAQHRFFGLVRGIQKGEARGSANAKKVAASMSPKSVKDYAKTKEKGLPEKVSEAVLGAQIRGQTSYGTQAMTGMPSRSAPADRAGTSAMTGMPSRSAPGMSGRQARLGGNPTAAPAARPAVGGARPSVIAKNSITRRGMGWTPSGPTTRGMGWTPSGPTTNAGVTALNKQTSQQVPNSGAAKPAAAPAPAAAAPAPAAAAPAPAAKPAAAAPAAKPAAAKVTPVRKQSSAGATKPAKRNRLTRYQRDSAVVGPGGRLG